MSAVRPANDPGEAASYDPARCYCKRCERADRREAWGWYQLSLFPMLPGKVAQIEAKR